MHKESSVAGELFCVVKHKSTAMKKTAIYIHTKGGFDLNSSPVCHMLFTPVCSIPLGISKMHKKSFQISCPFWNFPQIDACVDCLINLLHVGNMVFLLMRRLSQLSSFLSPCYKVMGEGLECFYCCSEIVLCQLSMQLPFPAYLPQVEDHYNKPRLLVGMMDIMTNFRK